ncbi:glycosyltransferase family 1 protein [Nocardioides sp.]|uniref:glycosyltransferase family 4 protein n=1 Tax=Nocardioides sp. TaxID=35761 RepID=UPI0031FED161|nr:glycosyltransferase family 1 protein [Nocardioides sp.]
MRVAVVTESFLPQVNGVSNTVRHVVDRLRATGHEPLVVAPGPGSDSYRGIPVVRVRSVGLPGYRSFPLGLPDPVVQRVLTEFRPDVVHLASPIVLGAVGLRAARRLGVPTVAVYQTDVGGFARQYGLYAESAVSRWVGRLHRRATRTLVPSKASYRQLGALGVTDMHIWGRGVSLDLFGPDRRDEALREHWTGHVSASERPAVIGYVGRLAPEKRLHRLTELADLPGVQLVVVGDGPERGRLERLLPEARFTGQLQGADLARTFASLDIFVHTGESETFCQTVQEAQASGVAVVAPAAGGPLDLIEHGRTGLLFDVKAPGSLRRHVLDLVDHPDVRRDLAATALDRVAHRTWSHLVDELVRTHYGAVLVGPAVDVAA